MADIGLDNDLISSLNSSSTPLGANGTFSGVSEDVTRFPTVTISVYSNVASATNGLSAQFSSNGTNWDHIDTFSIIAGVGKVFTIGRVARYFRLVYTNGPVAQSSFRLQVIFNESETKPSSHKIQDSITTEDDAELVKAVITGENSQLLGTFENVLTKNGRLLVSQEEVTPSLGATVAISTFNDVSSTAGVDTFYTITDGKTLTIQVFSAGSEGSSGGSVTELFYDPNGDLSVLTRIVTIFTDSSTQGVIVNEDFVGNGTRRIVMRQRGYTGTAREMAARWRGFEV